MKRCLSFILILTLFFSCVSINAFAGGDDYLDDVEWHIFNKPGYVEIMRDYSPIGFIWKDEMMKKPSSTFNPEIAKVSAALSVLAYDRNAIIDILTSTTDDYDCGMGFQLSTSYFPNSSFSDNDHVAYTVAYKEQEDGSILYCVAVRGTDGYEWYSDFRLGENNGGKHLGFHMAANELMTYLRQVFSHDGRSASNRHILITGHSRGAAVANIIAPMLMSEQYAASRNLYCYTFACPAVSKSASADYPNIINFINRGDIVPTVPLEDWGYKRNGSDWKFGVTRSGDVYQKILRDTGEAFNGFTGTADFISILKYLIPDEDTYFDAWVQIVMNIIGYKMSGRGGDAGHAEALRNKLLSLMGDAGIEMLQNRLTAPINFTFQYLSDLGNYYAETVLLAGQFIAAAMGKSEEEQMSGFGSTLRSRLEEFWESGFTCLADIQSAAARMNSAIAAVEIAKNNIGALIRLLSDSNGDLLGALDKGHHQNNYFSFASTTFLGFNSRYQDYNLTSFDIQDVETIGPWCFSECRNLESVTFDSNLRYIGSESFYNTALTGDLCLPEGVLGISDSAFDGCENLTSVHFPHSLRWLGSGAIGGENITEVTMPIEVVGYHSFYTGGVTTIHFLKGSTGVMADYKGLLERRYTLMGWCIRNLSTLTFEEGITHIGAYAFQAYDGYSMVEGALTNVTLPSTLQSIGEYAFSGQNHLAEINLPEGLTELGESCFGRCGLESVSIPDSVEAIPQSCFYENTKLQSVSFSEGLKSIGTRAFEGCNSLEALALPHTIETIGEYAFFRTDSLKELSIPAELCGDSLRWHYMGPIEKIHYLRGSTGIMPNKTNSQSVEQGAYRTLKEVDFEEGITHIGDYAFAGPASPGVLEKVTLPSTVTTIGNQAFSDQPALKNIILPEGLTSIGSSCFKGSGLQKVDLPSTLASLGENCFAYNSFLGLVRFRGNAPEFGNTAVFDCNVSEVVWPADGTGWDQTIPALSLSSLFCHPDNEPALNISGNIKVLEESALENTGAAIFELSSGVETIGADVFSNETRDILIRVPASVVNIDDNAFRSNGRVFIVAPKDSIAWQHADQSGIYRITAPD